MATQGNSDGSAPAHRDDSLSGSTQDLEPTPGRRLDRRDAWVFAGVLGVLAAYTLYGSFAFPIEIRRWPLGLSVFILACLTIYALQQAILARRARDPNISVRGPEALSDDYGLVATRATIAATIGFTAFLIAAYFFSFMLATAVFLPLYMVLAGERRPVTVVGVTAGMLLAVWLMFGGILNAPVESGQFLSLDWLIL